MVPWIKSKGGVERAILRLLNDDKCSVDVYTFDYEKDKTFEEFKNYKIHQIGWFKNGTFLTKGLKLFLNTIFYRIKGLYRYDIFMISTAGIAEFAVFRNPHRNTVALTHTPLRVAHNMYEYYKNRSLKYRVILPPAVMIYRVLEKLAWKHIDYAIVFSEEVKNRLTKYGIIDSSRIFKIGPHVDYSNIKRSGRSEKIIFYSGRFISYKRQDLAVRAFKRSSLKNKGFKLVIGGFVEDREYFDKVKRLAEGDDSIVIKQNLSESELKGLYSKCYATLFLAINEDTGLVPLESLAYGKPVISVNEGGPKEFIKNGVNGLLVAATETGVTNALDKIAKESLYARLRKGAIMSPQYDEETMLSKFNAAVKSILSWENRKLK